MSTALVTPRLPSLRPTTLMWIGGILLLSLLWLLMISGQFKILCAALIAGTLLLVCLRDRALALQLTLAYLFLLGDIRRLVTVAAGQSAFDPLLLVGPGMALLFAAPSLVHLRLRDNLSKMILALLLLMLLEILNPAQGGLAIGLSGAFFYIVPLLWFWIGRSYGSPAVVETLLYKVVLPLAIAAAVLGLFQTFVGLLPYEQAWVNATARVYTSIYVGSSVRSFGYSVSAAEYATLLELSIAAIVAAYLARRRAWLLALPLLIAGLVLASGRGLMIKLVIALSIIWVVRKGVRVRGRTLIKVGALGLASLIALSLIAARFAPSSEMNNRSATAAQSAAAHQFGGLAHPFDKRYSSAGLHSDMVVGGLFKSLSNPLGRGLGATTFAGQKFTTDQAAGSSELDFSDMFVALGLIGGLLYLAVPVFVARAGLNYVRTVPRRISLPAVAIITATAGAWLIGGQYSICALVFFLIGSLVFEQNQIVASPFARDRFQAGVR